MLENLFISLLSMVIGWVFTICTRYYYDKQRGYELILVKKEAWQALKKVAPKLADVIIDDKQKTMLRRFL